jgi:hypothetical protein
MLTRLLFWPDMPAAFQTEVIMEAVDKAMGTGVVEELLQKLYPMPEGLCLTN